MVNVALSIHTAGIVGRAYTLNKTAWGLFWKAEVGMCAVIDAVYQTV